MKRIAMLVYEDSYSSMIGGVIDLLAGTNYCLANRGLPPAFGLTLIGDKAKNVQLDERSQFLCQETMDMATVPDLIIIPGFKTMIDAALGKYGHVISWLKEMHRLGAEVASMCVGSYFLAEAGLLDDKIATSHWGMIADMKARYPAILVKGDRVITDQEGVYTSGGAFSAIKLVLYLIEKFAGRATVLEVSKTFSIELNYEGQSYFSVFHGQKEHQDEGILKSQTFMEQHYAEEISIEQVAVQSNMGKRNFIRRFKAATHNTPLEYLQRIRIEAAKKALENDDSTLQQIMNNTGYEDVKTFRIVFKRMTGLSPRDYRKKYSRIQAQ
jgi:transcriptional regulator GlxA family with amidase domain